jgi:site-specific DNA recombinase
VPHLAIVEPELWEQVQAIKIKRGHAKPAYRRKPKHMLSGLLRCGSCKGGMSIKGVDRGGTRIVCTQYQNARTCSNERTYYLHHIEQTVLGGLRKHLTNPAEINYF